MYPQTILIFLTLTITPLITAFPHPHPHPHPHHEQQPRQEGISFPSVGAGDTGLPSLPTLSLPTAFPTIPGFGSGSGGGFGFPTGFPSIGEGVGVGAETGTGSGLKKKDRRQDGIEGLIPTIGTGLPPLSLPSFTTSGIDTLPTGFPALTGLGFVPTGSPDSGVVDE